MAEIEAADRRRRQHREAFRQNEPRVRTRIEQVEQHRLQAVIGTRRIARRGANAAIFFLDQGLARELLTRCITPQFRANMLVQPFGKRFGKTIRERLQQDVRIIVLVGLKARKVRLDAVNADREPADPVAVMVDEVGQAHIRTALALGDLLAQEGKTEVIFVLEMDDDIVAFAPAGPQAHDAACGQPFLIDHLREHRLRVDP